jgi:SAM-dependent methyltransferase
MVPPSLTVTTVPRPDEIDRIRRVYGAYEADPRFCARWDDERPGNAQIVAERQATFARVLGDAGLWPLGDRLLLEVGCGAGGLLARFAGRGGRLVGADLLPDRLAVARRVVPGVPLAAANGEHLPFRDGAADVVVLATVLSSILDDDVTRRIADEVRRVVAPGGAVLLYDMRLANPRNPNIRPLSRRGVERLFPGARVRWVPVTVLPPLARALPRAYPVLARVPFLRSHCVALVSP